MRKFTSIVVEPPNVNGSFQLLLLKSGDVVVNMTRELFAVTSPVPIDQLFSCTFALVVFQDTYTSLQSFLDFFPLFVSFFVSGRLALSNGVSLLPICLSMSGVPGGLSITLTGLCPSAVELMFNSSVSPNIAE